MKKKEEMMEYLASRNISIPVSWNDIQKVYYSEMENKKNLETPIVLGTQGTQGLKETQVIGDRIQGTQEVIQPVRVLTRGEKLQLKRDKLYPDIKRLVLEMKGQTKATPDQIKELFALYNAYYLRRDNPGCGVCLTRVYVTLTKLVKKNK